MPMGRSPKSRDSEEEMETSFHVPTKGFDVACEESRIVMLSVCVIERGLSSPPTSKLLPLGELPFCLRYNHPPENSHRIESKYISGFPPEQVTNRRKPPQFPVEKTGCLLRLLRESSI